MSPRITPDMLGDDGGDSAAFAQREDPAPFLRAAVSLLKLGRPAEAVRAASEACHCAPQLAEAHYVYSQSWLALNEAAKAERTFAEAIQLAPAWAEPWVNYGIARYHQDAIADAKGAMRRVLALSPDHSAALPNPGAFLPAPAKAGAGVGKVVDAGDRLARKGRSRDCAALRFSRSRRYLARTARRRGRGG
jgi:tetratricopeptide (TPR) repeat protein